MNQKVENRKKEWKKEESDVKNVENEEKKKGKNDNKIKVWVLNFICFYVSL